MERKLGRSGIKVSAMGIGLWAIGGHIDFRGDETGWGEVDDGKSIRAIHAALDHGINFVDTAANYGCGHSERILARAIKGRRDQVVIATKFGHKMDEINKAVADYGPDPATSDVVSHLREDCEASLRRLNTDVIDLYQFHVNEYNPEKSAKFETLWRGWSGKAKSGPMAGAPITRQGRGSSPGASTARPSRPI